MHRARAVTLLLCLLTLLVPLSVRADMVDAITPEIQALADGLHADPVQIYAYVKNHITYEHYHGAKKGAMLTLLEGSGNDFDQCALLVALLRAAGANAGVQTVQYRFGWQWIAYQHATAPDLVQWLGLDPVAYPHLTWSEALAQHNQPAELWQDIPDEQRKKNHLLADVFLKRRGTPDANVIHEITSAGLTRLRFKRVWVRVTIDGTTYELDPALKQHDVVPGLALQAAAGYDRAALLQAVGGTSPPERPEVSVRGLDEAALHATLTAYTTQLQTTLRQTASQATPVEVVGGLRPRVEPITSLPTTLPLPTQGSITTWDAIPDAHIAKLVLTLKGNVSTTLLLPELQGQKLVLTFAGNTASVWLEDTLKLSAEVSPSATTVKLKLHVNHPGGGENDREETKEYKKADDYAYALLYGFTPSERRLRHRQGKLDALRREALAAYPQAIDAHGLPDPQLIPEATLKRRLRTELLNVLGLQWLYQTILSHQLIAAQRAVLLLAHHRFGRMAQEESYYIDVGLQLHASVSRSGVRADEATVSAIRNFFASAMEHGVLEQIPGITTPAMSTIKLLQLANRSTDPARDELFLVSSTSTLDAVTPPACMPGASPQCLQGYSEDLKTTLRQDLTQGATLLLPEHAQYTLNAWSGHGYAAVAPDHVRMTITVGLQPINGGRTPGKAMCHRTPARSGTIPQETVPRRPHRRTPRFGRIRTAATLSRWPPARLSCSTPISPWGPQPPVALRSCAAITPGAATRTTPTWAQAGVTPIPMCLSSRVRSRQR